VGVALQAPPRDLSGGNFTFDPDGDGPTGTDPASARLLRFFALASSSHQVASRDGGNCRLGIWGEWLSIRT
jgi:hypothetical protein